MDSAASGRSTTVRFCALIVLSVFVWAAPAEAMTLVEEQPLASRVDESVSAALVRVAAVRYGYDERGLHSTFVAFDVEDPIYGDELPATGKRLELKFYGAPVALDDGSRVFVDGTPRYRAGELYVLLLTDESEWGFRSTTGLAQGAFRVAEDDDGVLRARGLAHRPRTPGEAGSNRDERLTYVDLRTTLRGLWTDLGRRLPTPRGSLRPGVGR